MRIIFMGTPDFAKESLEAIWKAGYEIVGVVTNPDKMKGRGMKVAYSPVKEFAKEKNLNLYQPEKVRNNKEFVEQIKQLQPDMICVVAYGKILPKELLEIPKLGCINVHGSLLPKYRGAAPIQWAIINGEKTTGITTMYMNEGMDTGDIILKEEVTIQPDETTKELWEELAKVGASLLIKTIQRIQEGTAPRIPQTGEFSMAPMLNKEIGNIPWKEKEAIEIKNLVRGLDPILGAYTFYEGKKLKFWKVEVIPQEEIQTIVEEKKIQESVPGTILVANEKKGLFIKTKRGILKVLEIQAENAKRMPINDFLRGNTLKEFVILSEL